MNIINFLNQAEMIIYYVIYVVVLIFNKLLDLRILFLFKKVNKYNKELSVNSELTTVSNTSDNKINYSLIKLSIINKLLHFNNTKNIINYNKVSYTKSSLNPINLFYTKDISYNKYNLLCNKLYYMGGLSMDNFFLKNKYNFFISNKLLNIVNLIKGDR